MVKRIVDFVAKEIKGLHEAAYILAFFTFASQLLGLVRDRMLAGKFGTGGTLDIYYASFRLPDLIFVIVTFIVSSAILVPILSSKITENKLLKETIDSVFTLYVVITFLICLAAFIFAPSFLKIVVPGFSGEQFETLIQYTRILLLSPMLLGISQLFGSIVQTYRRFFIYAISPILYNLGIVLGILFFVPKFGNVGLVYGVILGLVLHVLIQLPFIMRSELLPKITFSFDKILIRQIIQLSIPRSVALVSSQFTLIFLTAIASIMTVGSITIFTLAYNLQSVPMAIIGVSYSLAAFPTLSRLFAEGNFEEFLSKIIVSARHIIFWSIPVMSLFIVLRAQIVRTILGTGVFSWNDTRLVAAVLAMFSVSILAQSLILLLVRGYYAAGNTKKPVMINIFSTLIIFVLTFLTYRAFYISETFKYFLERIFRVENLNGTEILILPFAFSVGTIINLIWMWASFENNFKGFSKTLMRTLLQSLISAFVVGYVAYIALQYLATVFDLETLLGIFLQGLFAGLIGIGFGVLVLILMGNKEFLDVVETMHHKIWKAKPIAEGQKEL